jgi:DNA-binding NarL/FixJ family response regulator
MVENNKIRVFIADDFDAMRTVIHKLVGRSEDMEMVGEAPDLNEALEEVETLQPDVILMNDYLPPTNSIVATKLFRELKISAAILIISTHVEPDMIQQAFTNGANGFMYKGEMGGFLIEAIRKVYNNEQYLSPIVEEALAHAND